MVKKESAVVLQVTAKNISAGMEKVRVALKRKQEEEKSGKNKKASTEAFTMVKNMNSYITDEMGYLGSDIRKRIEAGLKKMKIKAKISTVGQNQFNKIKLMRSAFSSAPRSPTTRKPGATSPKISTISPSRRETRLSRNTFVYPTR